LICLSVRLTRLGVPVEAVGLVMGIDPLVGMLRCMSNCLGDVAVSCMVAKKKAFWTWMPINMAHNRIFE